MMRGRLVRRQVILERLRADVLEYQIRPGLGEVLAQKPHEVRVFQTSGDRRFALERGDGVALAESVRPEDLDRDVAEQCAIPRVEHLVPAARFLGADDHEALIDLVALLEVPALFHSGRQGKHRAAGRKLARAEKQLLQVGERGSQTGDEE